MSAVVQLVRVSVQEHAQVAVSAVLEDAEARHAKVLAQQIVEMNAPDVLDVGRLAAMLADPLVLKRVEQTVHKRVM